MLPLDEIIADARTQVRAAIDEAVVDEYVEQLDAGVVFPPVTVFRSEAGTYLADGFHRVAVHRRDGRTEIAADIRTGNQADALWFALGANRAHGHRLTAADKKHAVELALEAWPERSQARIAEQIGCSQQYVSKIRQVTTSCDLPDRSIGKDGKSYPARRTPSRVRREPQEPGAIEDAHRNGRSGAAEPTADTDDLTARPELGTGRTGPAAGSEQSTQMHPEPTKDPTKERSQRAQNLSNQIVSVVASDALNLTAQEYLIDFRALDRHRLTEWIADLEKARHELGRLIQRLRREAGDDNDPAAIEDPAGRA